MFSFVLLLLLMTKVAGYRSISTQKKLYLSNKCSQLKEKNADVVVEVIENEFKLDQSIAKLKTDYPPETIAILSVYFVQGALGLSRLAVSYFLKDDLHLLPADAAALMGFTSLPWLLKPIYGFLSDGFPLWGYKRRSYLVLSGIFGCMSWIALSTIVHDANSAFLAILVGSASIAVSDVVVDSIVVERSRPSPVEDIPIIANEESAVEDGRFEKVNKLQHPILLYLTNFQNGTAYLRFQNRLRPAQTCRASAGALLPWVELYPHTSVDLYCNIHRRSCSSCALPSFLSSSREWLSSLTKASKVWQREISSQPNRYIEIRRRNCSRCSPRCAIQTYIFQSCLSSYGKQLHRLTRLCFIFQPMNLASTLSF
jgi:hypothetical protein